MKQEANLFFTALQFYTRFPAPKWLEYKPENLSLATKYLPVIGWIVGLITGIVWVGGIYLTDVPIGLLFSIGVGILTTGLFMKMVLPMFATASAEVGPRRKYWKS